MVEERDVWQGTAPPAVAAAVTSTAALNETCPVFVGGPERLDRCKKYAEWWATRAAGRACSGGFTYSMYTGDLADLAADLASDVGPAADAARQGRRSPATAGLVLACYLEAFLNPAILFDVSDRPAGSGGGYRLRNGGAGSLPVDEKAAAAWVQAAAVLKLRGSGTWAGRVGAMLPSLPTRATTLALQLRAPDYEVIATNRSTKPETYCLAGAIKCDPARHLFVPREVLLNFLGDVIAGPQPLLAEARRSAAGGTGTPTLESPSLAPITHVHLLTNDDVLGADVTEHLQARGVRVTSSPDRSLASLMQDYAAAVNAAVFWGTRGSSISANIVHARLAAGRATRTTVFWEDVDIGQN